MMSKCRRLCVLRILLVGCIGCTSDDAVPSSSETQVGVYVYCFLKFEAQTTIIVTVYMPTTEYTHILKGAHKGSEDSRTYVHS